MPADKLVAVYRKIRSAIEEKEEAHKQTVGELKEQLDAIGNQLLSLCNDQNVDSLKTSEGTVSRTVKSRYWTTDWESMYRFIRENDSPQLLEQRIHNGNMKQFIEENPDAFPVGLQCDRKYAVTVRKPTAK
jgi:predicted secreted Zn-dependent protease